MIKYEYFQPTSQDVKGLKAHHYPDWDATEFMKTRDACILTNCNFQVAKEALEALDMHDDWDIPCFNHWLCGWYELIVVKPDTPAHKLMQELEEAMDRYPILDELRYSQLQFEAVCDYWEKLTIRERMEYCKEVGVSIFAARHDEIPEALDCILYETIY
jgi:hypothetical protein